jgi:hypothetical protein
MTSSARHDANPTGSGGGAAVRPWSLGGHDAWAHLPTARLLAEEI